MAKTLDDLRSGVRSYLDESAEADFLDEEIDRAINYAYHDLVSEIMEIYQYYYVSTTPFYISTVDGQREYTLDSSIIKPVRVEINFTPSNSNSKPIRARYITLRELPLYLDNPDVAATSVNNCAYYVIGAQSSQKIGLLPIAAETGTNNVSVWAIVAPSDLSSSTDPVLIPYPDLYSELIELKAAAKLLRKGQQEEVAAKQYLQDYLVGVTRMKNFLMDRQTDDPMTITDTTYDDIDFSSPF